MNDTNMTGGRKMSNERPQTQVKILAYSIGLALLSTGTLTARADSAVGGGISEFGKNRTLSEQVATRDAIVKHFVIYGIVLILD